MSSQRFIGGLIALWLILSCRTAVAIAPAPLEPAPSPAPAAPAPSPVPTGAAPSAPSSYYVQPQNPALVGQTALPTPAAVALPANGTSDASTSVKFYTLTASLREIYDDNVNTASNGAAKSSLETDLSPSVLVDFPDKNGDFSARYTLGLTYYTRSPTSTGNGSASNSSSGNNQGELQITHELVAAYNHQFSDRFSVAAAEAFRYFTEPSILQSTGTNYQNGPYVSNTINGTFTAQWTPLLSSSTSFSDTVIRYQDSSVGATQNSLENTGSATLGYSVVPKLTANLGGIIDDLTYQTADRGYTSYTGFVGATWQALPSVSVVGRGGASYTEPAQTQIPGQAPVQGSFAPYAALNINWTLGARSSLAFGYAHEITPSDQADANGQVSDRFNANFSYLIMPRLSAYLTGVFTEVSYSGAVSSTSNSGEADYEVDSGLTYSYNSAVSFNGGLTNSGVISDNSNNNNYTRDEVYVGVRGTY